jgi:CheY-like chemotaxis protein
MVIDDDWLVATALSRILTKSYDVVTEHSGTAALETLRRDPAFDVIVCDVMMPEMDGPTLYEALASYEPHLRSRFLFISGGDVSLGPQRFLEQSAVKLLKKPVRRADLYEAVAELVASTM